MATEQTISITVKFTGGAEYLFGNVKSTAIVLPEIQNFEEANGATAWTVKALLKWLVKNRLKERSEMFVQGETVRPGILILINDVDWELLDGLDYRIKTEDTIVFMSTLHGG